jgi:L,D-transpeptidase catalytic domain
MKKILVLFSFFIPTFLINAANYYGPSLCAYSEYQCLRVSSGVTWENLFPNEQQRDLVQRLNRSYNYLWAGKIIVVPRNMAQKTILDFSPFPLNINADGEKQVIVDQDKLAWGAYDRNGQLVKWGPISSGRDKCPDSIRSCRTMTGIFRFFSKENERCISNVYPIGKGGAKMPYCMYFHKGFALHGSPDIPGYRASHGCVRLFTRDALWLNHNFVELSNENNHYLGTKVVIRPVLTKEKDNENYQNYENIEDNENND